MTVSRVQVDYPGMPLILMALDCRASPGNGRSHHPQDQQPTWPALATERRARVTAGATLYPASPKVDRPDGERGDLRVLAKPVPEQPDLPITPRAGQPRFPGHLRRSRFPKMESRAITLRVHRERPVEVETGNPEVPPDIHPAHSLLPCRAKPITTG